MLSILIPTYNYNIYPLVSEIQRQCLACKIIYEIISLDDASKLFHNENNEINMLPNCSYLILENNIGRTSIRNLLAKKAKFEWILFLDADVIPTAKNFISKYLERINFENEIIVGGIKYFDEKPKHNEVLRYKYGKSREEKSASVRNLKPYSSIVSGNLLIKKDLFLATNYLENNNIYGMDIFFSYQLFKNKVPVLHIDNAVYHLGLETNEIFFKKSLEAVKSRKNIMVNLQGIETINPLIKHYKFLLKYRLLSFYIFLFKVFEPIFKKNILSKNPNLFCFDLYRLGYLCCLENH